MTEDIHPQLGISRRDLLRRGAVVGGALVWAAPTVQAISQGAAFAGHGTPAAISFVMLTFTCDGGKTVQKAKYEDDTDAFEEGCESNNPHCSDRPNGWAEATCVGENPPIRVFESPEGTLCFRLTDLSCEFVDGIAVDGSRFGCIRASSQTTRTICFDDPDQP